jgi:hypothetical protein
VRPPRSTIWQPRTQFRAHFDSAEFVTHGKLPCLFNHAQIPEEWYEGDRDGLNRLVETLHHRRGAIRKLINEIRSSSRNLFPNWRDSPAAVDVPGAKWDESLNIG